MGDTPRQEELDLTTGSGAEPPVRPVGEPVQAGLFPDDSVPDELVGYRGPSACQIAGITYRQLDYWARTSLVVPSIRGAAGSGSQSGTVLLEEMRRKPQQHPFTQRRNDAHRRARTSSKSRRPVTT